jgi:hypothetical protein
MSLLFLGISQTLSKEDKESKEVKEFEKAEELIDFKNIQEVLKSDSLDQEVKKKKKAVSSKKRKTKRANIRKFNVPGEDHFWSFFTEYWIIRNVTLLKWDFEKPDYGLDVSLQRLFEGMGIYEKKFKILLLNTSEITHFALPSNPGEYIFLLSVPFIRTLDLGKLEISLLLFEDYIRMEKGYFKNMVMFPELKKFIGENFFKKKIDKEIFKKLSKKYDDVIYKKGFNFQKQFEVTKRMNSILRPDVKLWNSYYLTLKKIDTLVKTNLLYKNYLKLYPSPELQINWLKPTNKKIP